MDMKNKPIDEALRDFQILFRMPGEAQKIDKIMQIFALEYYRFNREGEIRSEDAAYILAFAIMMLHTSLHNPAVKRRTTKKQWVSMNRGCNEGENFKEQFLLDIYDRISKVSPSSYCMVLGPTGPSMLCAAHDSCIGCVCVCIFRGSSPQARTTRPRCVRLRGTSSATRTPPG
jgi:hypothetical protein